MAMAVAPREQQSEEGAEQPRERRGSKERRAALLEAPRATAMTAALLESDQSRADQIRATMAGAPRWRCWRLPRDACKGTMEGLAGRRCPARTVEALQALRRGVAVAGAEAGGTPVVAGGGACGGQRRCGAWPGYGEDGARVVTGDGEGGARGGEPNR